MRTDTYNIHPFYFYVKNLLLICNFCVSFCLGKLALQGLENGGDETAAARFEFVDVRDFKAVAVHVDEQQMRL